MERKRETGRDREGKGETDRQTDGRTDRQTDREERGTERQS